MQTNFSSRTKFLGLGLICLLAVAWSALPAQAQPPDPALPSTAGADESATGLEPVLHVTTSQSELKLVEKFAKVVSLENKVKRVDGFDPDVISVSALAPNQIRVQGTRPGVTSMVLVDEFGKTYEIEVFVVGDVRHLQAYINRLFPRAAVEAVSVRDGIVLRGWVQQPEHITEIVELTQQFTGSVLNQLKVGGVQQVMLKVKVMEVQRSKLRRLGVNWVYLNNDSFLASTPGALVPLTGATAPIGGSPSVSINGASLAESTITGGFVSDSSSFQAFVEALKQESLLKIMAEPTLVTTNGRPATLLSGGEFPILVPQGLNTVTIEYREFGVRLEAVPILLGQGRVRLELQPEVSEQDFTTSVQVNGFLVPGLTVRRVNTQVEMRFGETFVLAGLISTRDSANTDKVPILGEIPWLGVAFSRKRYEEAETELVIMVTPELAGPITPGHVPPGGPGRFTVGPSDRELYRDGMIEIPYYGNPCEGCPTGAPAPAFDRGSIQYDSADGAEREELAPNPEQIQPPAEQVEPISSPPDDDYQPVPSASAGSPTPSMRTGNRMPSRYTGSPEPPLSGKAESLLERARSLFQTSAPTAVPVETATQTTGPDPRAAAGRGGLIQPQPGMASPPSTYDPFSQELIRP